MAFRSFLLVGEITYPEKKHNIIPLVKKKTKEQKWPSKLEKESAIYLLKSNYIGMLQGPVIHNLPLYMLINLQQQKKKKRANQSQKAKPR